MILKVTYKLTALFLTFVLLANNINNVVIVTNFVINQEVIAKTLCIQKENQKGCNGKCQLTIELAENNTNSNQNAPLPDNERTHLDFFVINTFRHLNVEEFSQISQLHSNLYYKIKAPTTGFYTIDTPPPNLC